MPSRSADYVSGIPSDVAERLIDAHKGDRKPKAARRLTEVQDGMWVST